MALFKERSSAGQICSNLSALTGPYIILTPLEMRKLNILHLDTDSSLGIRDVKLI